MIKVRSVVCSASERAWARRSRQSSGFCFADDRARDGRHVHRGDNVIRDTQQKDRAFARLDVQAIRQFPPPASRQLVRQA